MLESNKCCDQNKTRAKDHQKYQAWEAGILSRVVLPEVAFVQRIEGGEGMGHASLVGGGYWQ